MAKVGASKHTTFTRHSQINSRFHTKCLLTDVETTKRVDDFPINLKHWKFNTKESQKKL